MPVQELDRVLDRHDVLLAGHVDLVQHRRERGGLARAGGTRDEHEAAWLAREVVDDRRQPELVDRGELEGDQAEGGADRAPLVISVNAEAGVAWNRVGEVELPVGLKTLALVAGEDRVDDLACVGGVKLRVAIQARQATANTDRGRCTGGQVQIRGATRDDLHQEVGEIDLHDRIARSTPGWAWNGWALA